MCSQYSTSRRKWSIFLILCVCSKVFCTLRELKASDLTQSFRFRGGNGRSLWFFVCSKVFYITLREPKASELEWEMIDICDFFVRSKVFYITLREPKASDLEWEIINLYDLLCVQKYSTSRCANQSFRFRVGNDRSLWFFVCVQKYSASRCANSKIQI